MTLKQKVAGIPKGATIVNVFVPDRFGGERRFDGEAAVGWLQQEGLKRKDVRVTYRYLPNGKFDNFPLDDARSPRIPEIGAVSAQSYIGFTVGRIARVFTLADIRA